LKRIIPFNEKRANNKACRGDNSTEHDRFRGPNFKTMYPEIGPKLVG